MDDSLTTVHHLQEFHRLFWFTETDVTENVRVVFFSDLFVEVDDELLVHVVDTRVLTARSWVVLQDIFVSEVKLKV